MSFKSVAVLIAMLFLVGGCAKESLPSSPPLAVAADGSGDCLSHFHDHLNDFFNGRSTPDEVVQFWDCTASAVSEYERLTTPPGQGEKYSPQAVRHFFEHYFLKTPISDQLLTSFMQVKQVLLGGTTDGLTRHELDLLQDFLQELKAASLDVQPYMPILLNHKNKVSDAELEQAAGAADRALARLGIWLVNRNETYSTDEMRTLVAGLQDWQALSPATAANLNKALDLFPNLKKILVGGNQDAIAGSEWADFTTALSKGFYLYLSGNYGFKQDLNVALDSDSLPNSFYSVVQLLTQKLATRPNRTIPMAEWDALFTKVAATGWLPSAMTAQSLHNAWMWLDCRLLSSAATCAGDWGSAQAQVLQSQLSNWQNLLQFSGDNRLDSDLKRQFWTLVTATPPMGWDDSGRMTFPVPTAGQWGVSNIRRMVWPFVVLNWIKTAYLGAAPQAVTEDQATTIATEVLPVLQGFGWLKDTQVSIGKKLVREGDSFTLSANGNGQLELGEATRYLAFVASAYRSAKTWLDEAQATCGSHDIACVRQVGLTPTVMAPMPRFLKVMSALPPDRFVQYMQAAENTILGHTETGEVKTADLMQVWVIFEYVETFEMRYDTDFSETINLAESEQAFQVFGPTLGRLLHQPLSEVHPFFTFLMKYGDNPYTMFGGQIAYNSWKWFPNSWKFETDRQTLVQILEQLSKI